MFIANSTTTSDGTIEYDKYGEPTGERFVRCTGCGVEILEGDTRHATHRDGCNGPDE